MGESGIEQKCSATAGDLRRSRL